MKRQGYFEHGEVKAFKFGYSLFKEPQMFVHVYFVDGLLIDTGQTNMQKELISTLSNLPVAQIFITHHHEDHTGNIRQLQDHFGCAVKTSSLCAEIMKSPPCVSLAQRISWGKATAFHDFVIEDKEIITPKYRFEMIPVPGHAKDMYALYERSQGWLFSADLWVSPFILYFMRAESMREQIQSLKRVLTLDVQVLFCSHRPQLEGVRDKLNAKLAFFEDFYGKVLYWRDHGYSEYGIMKKMELKEVTFLKWLSQGQLSRINMIRAVLRDEERSHG